MKNMLVALACSLVSLAGPGLAQTADELLNDGKNPENVTTYGMGYDLKMYSPLAQIDRSNVKRLAPVWSFSLANDMGEHSQPTVYNGVMYVVNGNWTFAIDVATGRQIWRTPVQYERAALRVGTAGAIMRGPATIYNGKLFRQTVDAHVIALDMKTGKEVWKTKFAEYKEGYIGVIAPIIVISSFQLAELIIAESSLSFLGLGVQPPTPSWGGMLSQGREYLTSAWWLGVFPGLAIILTVLGINLFGDALRDAMDPRLRV